MTAKPRPLDLASAVAAPTAIAGARANKAIVEQNPNVAMFELVGRMRGIASDALVGLVLQPLPGAASAAAKARSRPGVGGGAGFRPDDS